MPDANLPDNHEPIVGRYVNVTADGETFRLFYEEAGPKDGGGVPLICLHTAGTDSRQFRHVLNDPEVTANFRVIAFDLPYHGRSNPPDGWWLKKYHLTEQRYLALIREFWRALGLERPVVMGCSMGGAIVLKVAAVYQEEITGIVRAGECGGRRRARQRLSAPSGDPRRRAGGELHLRPQRPDVAGGQPARKLVVLQPVRPGGLQGRRLVLLRGQRYAGGDRLDRHQPLQGLAACPASTTIRRRRR